MVVADMKRPFANDPRKMASAVTLAVLLPLSLILTATTNRQVGQLLSSQAPSIAWIATAAIPSFLVIAMLYAFVGDKHALSLPSMASIRKRGVIGLSIGWLVMWLGGCIVAAIITGHWTVYARGWALVAAFLIFGPLGEEALFRGIIYEHAKTVRPSSPTFAIIISTMAFSLHHISLNAAPSGLALAQVLFTIPMGIVFALLRERTGSLWPGLFVHIATNLPATI
jgi:membrane protease YdiL (CAAX protease family)